MKKWKANVLLTISLVIIAVLSVLAFARFPVGTNDFNGFLGAIETDYDLSGGTAYTLTLARDNEEDVDNIQEVIDTLKYRLTSLGYQTYSVKALKNVDKDVKDYDIRIELRGSVNGYGEIDETTVSQDVAVACAYGEIKFYGGTESNPTTEILTENKAVADAQYVGAYSGSYQVNITFTDYGYSELMKLMEENSSYYLKISLGDTDLLPGTSTISSNYFNGKSLVITTGTEAGARQAALQIKSGGLAYKYEVSDGVSVSAPLGENAVTVSVIVIALILVAVIAAGFIVNKGFGFADCLSAVLFAELFLFMLIAIPGIKVSVGGVIGFALATILAGIGFNMISALIKEEFAKGKTVKSAVKTGLNRSVRPIAAVAGVALIVALSLFALTTGAVKNFALVFAIGTVLYAITDLALFRLFAAIILPINGYKPSFFGVKEDAIAEKDIAEEN